MLLRISHLSRYEYAQEVSLSPHVLYLRPRETPLHRLRAFSINVTPHARMISTLDPYENNVVVAHFWDRASALDIRTEFEIETLGTNPFDFLLKGSAIKFPFEYDREERFALQPYLAPPFNDTQATLRNWLDEHFVDAPTETVPYLGALASLLQSNIDYVSREEGRSQPSARTLELRSGSCRDSVVLFMEICRTLGVAARFVSGYLYDPPPPEAENPAAPEMHAWAEVYLPGAGWKGIDPTRGILCDDAFVPVAHSAQADVVSPVQGKYYAPVPVPSKLTTSLLLEKLS